MYRLIKFRIVPVCNFQGVSLFHNNSNGPLVSVSENTCRLCDRLQVFNGPSTGLRSSLNASQIAVIGSKRWQSTHTNPSVVTKKTRKKRSRTIKKYAEMLVVTNEKTSECQARVHNLKPNDVKMLALTNFNLSELYKLKDFMKRNDKIVTEHTYNNLTDIYNTPLSEYTIKSNILSANDVVREKFQITDPPVIAIAPMEILEKTEVEVEGEEENSLFNVLGTIKPNAAFQPEALEEEIVEPEEPTPEEPTKEVKKRPKTYDKKAREEMLARTLSAYIEVCAVRNMPHKGLKAYQFHRYRSQRFPEQSPPVKNIKIYNALLKGFAAKGDLIKLREVLSYADEEGVKLNVDSYAAIFECLARVNHQECQMKSIRIFTNEAMRDGITFDRILNEATFLYDQKERVIETMKCYDPNFVPKYFEPSVQFNNHLMNSLNHDDQLKGPPERCEEKKGLFTGTSLRERIRKQMDLERNVYVTVKSIEAKGEVSEDVLKYRLAWEEHKKLWEESAMQAFNRDLMTLTAKKSAVNLDAYIRSIPARDYVAIIVDEAQKIAQGSETYSPTINMLYRDLGNKVYARYKVLKKQKAGIFDKIYNVHSKYCDNYVDAHAELEVLPNGVDNLNSRQKWQWAEHSFKHEGPTITTDHQEWVPPVLQSIGKFLYKIVMHDIKIDVNALRLNSKHKNYLPAFYTVFRTQARVVKEEVKPHPILSKLYRASMPETLTFPAYELPMLCPPVPWTSVNTGGYLVAPCEVVRLPPQATMQKERFRDTLLNNLYPSLDSLNQLASVPWKVNLRILDAILEVFKSGGSSKLDVPEPPSALKPLPAITNDMDKTQKFNIIRQKLQHRRKKAEMYSLWCDCLYRLSLADHFRDEVFWLPHNMDFRGRVYPIPPHLNHLGSDLARSMLVFAESRPLGPHGLDWLKLHLVNLTGLKKRDTINERLDFANGVIDDILDSADNPMTGKMWWAESEEPWQTLACCIEIAAAHRSPDPEKYRSHFPVHQDGSCNGLQHYAALGRDNAGAFSVNLTPAIDPQDVYSAVAVLVEQKRKKDAEDGVEIAKILEGFVKRKVIKQTVMTTVYGVTRYGARLQIARQLKDIDEFPKESVWLGSSYLTTKTFESLRSMFTSTREIQDWFTECARLISSVCGQNVEWVTPLGFPIVQPYFRYKKINNTDFFHIDKFEKPNVMKQKNAFPPNFIHSLDSSHMMLTSLYCERAGITFVSVHDCYWTHPSTVHIMNKICREQFVALHSEPILEDLSIFMSEKYSYQDGEINDDGSVTELTKRKLNRLLRKLPRTGNFNIKEVLDSVYFFS